MDSQDLPGSKERNQLAELAYCETGSIICRDLTWLSLKCETLQLTIMLRNSYCQVGFKLSPEHPSSKRLGGLQHRFEATQVVKLLRQVLISIVTRTHEDCHRDPTETCNFPNPL